MPDRARRAESDGAGRHRLLDELGHRGEVVGGGVLVVGPALTHHVVAQRTVGDLGADVERVLPPGDVVEVLGERLPRSPLDPFVQRGAGDVLDALHQLDQRLLATRTHRSEADAAVAHHDGGDAVAGGRIHDVVPADLAVVVRVHVDPSGGDDRAVGVDGLGRGVGDRATHLHDPSVLDGDIAPDRGSAGAVDDGSTLDDLVEHPTSVGGLPSPIPTGAPPAGHGDAADTGAHPDREVS